MPGYFITVFTIYFFSSFIYRCFDTGGSLSQLWCARVSAAVCGNGTRCIKLSIENMAKSDNYRQSPRFDQITLCSFSGHSATIKRIEPLSNENSFVSASSDKTVKLWSIRHDQETSQCQWTYKVEIVLFY